MNKIELNNIAFQGQHGAYSEMACVEAFPDMQTCLLYTSDAADE